MASVYYICNLIPKYPLTYDNVSFVIIAIFDFFFIPAVLPTWFKHSLSTIWAMVHVRVCCISPNGEREEPIICEETKTNIHPARSQQYYMYYVERIEVCSAMLGPAMRREERPVFPLTVFGKPKDV